jgi:hypothetical protein
MIGATLPPAQTTIGMRIIIPALVALAVAGSLSAAAIQDRQLKDSDIKRVSAKLADYIEARIENKGLLVAENELAEEIAKLEKKKLDGAELLGLPHDLGRALWLSRAYDKQKPKKGKLVDIESDFGEVTFEYTVWTPSKYDARRNSYPLILCIPEEGKKTKAFLTERWTESDLRDNAVIAAVEMPEDLELWSAGGDREKPGGLAFLLTTFKALSETHAIDFDRVYLSGRGAGVGAALAIAERFPDRFAGVIGRAGDAGDTSPENFRNLPTWFAGAGAKATAFQDGVKESGYDNCTVQPDGKGEDIWIWMQSHARNSNPDKVTLVPGVPFPNRAYWVQVPPFDGHGTARVDAEIDRATNTITIQAEGVQQVTLYFNDLLVDMSKPVKVICNGVENEDLIPRDLPLTLDLIFFARCDPGKVFVATKNYSVPAAVATDEEAGTEEGIQK